MSKKTADFVLEVGVEELPASYVMPALDHLRESFTGGLSELRLGSGEISSYATPRRLAFRIPDLALRQRDTEEEATGPAVKDAYDADGNPTKALMGFARGRGVELSDIRRVTTDRGEYVAATVRHEGKPAAEVLPDLIERAIAAAPFPKTMRWSLAAPEFRFARPIRWLVCLLGDEVVAVNVAGVTAGARTRGHRFLSPEPLEIGEPSRYLEVLRQGSVVADYVERRKQLVKGIERLAKQADGRLVEDDELVEINNFLIEKPEVFLGRFDPVFLDLPREILVTSMREHQFYFAVEDAKGKLLPVFIGVRNGDGQNLEGVVVGNARVLRARLDDARYYWDTDLKVPPDDRVEDLAGITWLEGMGTMYDKSHRVVRLGLWLAAQWAPDAEPAVEHAALLMKTDLLGEMIGSGKEYAKLEGVIGAYYAEQHGADPDVVAAIREHLKPKGAGDSLPSTDAGSILAIADRLDSATGCFLAGKIPKGSEDPYGVRRAGNGVVRILLEQDRHLDLWSACERSLALFGPGGAPAEPGRVAEVQPELRKQLSDFWRGRVETALGNEDFAYDEVAAVVEADHGWMDPLDARHRAAALREHRQDESFVVLVIGFKRVANILRAETDAPETAAGAPGGARWEHPAETALAAALEKARTAAGPLYEKKDYPAVLNVLLEMRGAIDSFFDDVLINDPKDPDGRLRRLGLLSEVRALFVRGFDLSRIVVEG
jgi:glycyl-tRNA synthetase beta chain